LRSESATVADLIGAAEFILEFTSGLDRDAFLSDPKTQSAILYQFLELGEAVKRLSAGFRDRHPTIPWQQIPGMRDFAIPGYDAIELDDVWDAAVADVPDLLAYLHAIPAGDEDRSALQ
jgi:uncharacterized protein with HEPN domain